MNPINTPNHPAQLLPFRIHLADKPTVEKAATLRAQAYGHHLPELGARLALPEPSDYERGCVVIAATSRMDGEVLGSMRVHTNAYAPLPLEASIKLPDSLSGSRLAEATRLSVRRAREASVVRDALFKAFFMFTLDQGIDAMVVTGRSPVDRIYDGLLFRDLYEPGAFYAMAHVANLPHRVMRFEPTAAQSLWREREHPLYSFVFETCHPDIDVSAPDFFDAESLSGSGQAENHQLASPLV